MPITKLKIQELAAERLTRRQIAHQLGYSYSYVLKICQIYKIKVRKEVPESPYLLQVKQLAELGYTATEIAIQLGKHPASVRKVARKFGGCPVKLRRIPKSIRRRIYNMAKHGVYYRHIAEIFALSNEQVKQCVYRHYGGRVFATEATTKGKPPSEEKIARWAELNKKRLIKKYSCPDLAANAVALAATTIQEYPDGEGLPTLFWRIANARMVDEIRKEKGDSRVKKKRELRTVPMVEEPAIIPATVYSDELEQLREKISTLPDRVRRFGYTYLECGCNRVETMRQTGLSEASYYRTLSEMLSALRESYGLVKSSDAPAISGSH